MENSPLLGTSTSEGKMPTFFSIDRFMIPAKIAYFLNSARYSICDYMILFYVQTGLSPFQASVINGFQHVGGIIAAPLFGLLADRYGFHRLITVFLCCAAIMVMSLQPYFQVVYGIRNSCPVKNNVSNSDYQPNDERTNLFYAMFTSAFLASSFDGSIMSFTEVGVIARIRNSPSVSDLGAQRISAALGSSLGSLAYSFSIQYFPFGNISCYTGLFVTYIIFAVCLAISFHFLFQKITLKQEETQFAITEDLLPHLKRFRTIIFLLTVTFSGTVAAVMFSFLFIFLKEELNAPTLLLGTSLLVGNLSAFIVYGFASRLISLLGGPMMAISASTLVWALYLLALSYLSNPYYVLIIDTLHGFTFCLFKVASLEYLKKDTDVAIFSSMCGIVNALSYSCSFLFANIVGGKLYDILGPRMLFLGLSITCFVWGFLLSLFVIVSKFLNEN